MATQKKVLSKEIFLEFNEALARLVIYMLGAMLLASLMVSLAFAGIAYSAVREVGTYREAARGAQSNAADCHTMLVRTESKLEMVHTLFDAARGIRNDNHN